MNEPLILALFTAEGEADYPGYARISVPRDSEHWRIDEYGATNLTTIRWPVSTGGMDLPIVFLKGFIGETEWFGVPLEIPLKVKEAGITVTFPDGQLIVTHN